MADKIRWGVIGTAEIARNALIPAVQSSRNGVVLGVASRDKGRARAYADTLGIERAYGSYEEMLADPDIDAVYNPLPNDSHAPWSIAAAKAKKPTLCEKPIALNAAQAQQMVDAFRTENVLLAEAFMYRYHPQHQIVKDLLAAGTIGPINLINTAFTYSMPLSDTTNVRLKPELGGGGLLDVGCYCVNLCRFIVGEEPDTVTGQVIIGKMTGADEAFVGTLHFPSGVLAHFDCGMRGTWRQQYTLIGPAGSITVPSAFRPIEDKETIIQVRKETGEFWQTIDMPEIVSAPAVNQYRLMVEDFGDAVREGRTITYDPADSVKNMRVLDALIRAAREGIVVHL